MKWAGKNWEKDLKKKKKKKYQDFLGYLAGKRAGFENEVDRIKIGVVPVYNATTRSNCSRISRQ